VRSGFLHYGRRADDSGCPSDAEEGNDVTHAITKRVHPAQARKTVQALRRRVLHSVRRTRARQSSLRIGRKLDGGALVVASRLGKPTHVGGTSTGVVMSGRSAARRAPIALAREPHGASEKEGGQGLRPCEDQELGFGCSYVAVVAEVGRRSLVSNTLGKRAPKRAAGSSERGPSPSRVLAGETVGVCGG